MGRRVAIALAAVLLLALAGVAVAAARGGAGERPRAEVPGAGSGGEVVDLSAAADAKAKETHEHSRPQEGEIAAADLAALERDIKSRSKKVLGASPDDGVAPGAPSDKEVREAIRQMFTSPFGQRWGRLHAGIDLAAPTGRPIRAAASGRVILAAPTGGYGLYTCIAHNSSISTCYAHQSRFGARVGESVRQGDVIGYVGNTGHSFGAHLHFEVRIGGRPVDPMDYL
jgi:murein DD-endopeptidase MepM/ murein hydrolase activator NlpD